MMTKAVSNQACDHLLAPLLRAAEEFPDAPMVSFRSGTRFLDVSSTDLLERVRDLAKGLIVTGIKPGDRVALMSKTSLEWLITDFAIVAVGAVTVPIYETSSPSQVEWILQDSAASLLIVGTQVMATSATPIAVAAARCQNEVVVIATGGIEMLSHAGNTVDDADLDALIAAISPDDIATIMYTSGTTGRPKGCVLTHHNLRSNVHQISDALAGTLDPSDTCLLFLPLAHILTKSAALFCLEHRIRIAFSTSLKNLPEEFLLAKPTLIAAVPRIFEKVYAKAQHSADSTHKGVIFERAANVAVRWSQKNQTGSAGPLLRLEHSVYDRLVYEKIRNAFGGELRMAFSGGGPLGARLTSFFDGTGVRIYEGYGLTETSPILTLTRADGWLPGSVGRPVADTQVTLSEDDEVLAKGPQLFAGYWRNEQATADAFDEKGWFHTGDIGRFDTGGSLHIVGRSKDLIVTAAGKNVAPAPLEDLLKAHSLVSQAMVVGDGRPFVAALITLDEDAVTEWSEHHERGELHAVLQRAVDEVNTSVSRAESIRKFVVLPHDFDLTSEEITPTLKVRRAVVSEHYADAIDSIYATVTTP
jgi:long-chain acyl-CoA synthetase